MTITALMRIDVDGECTRRNLNHWLLMVDSNGIYVDILWANEIKINVRAMSHIGCPASKNMSTQHQSCYKYSGIFVVQRQI